MQHKCIVFNSSTQLSRPALCASVFSCYTMYCTSIHYGIHYGNIKMMNMTTKRYWSCETQRKTLEHIVIILLFVHKDC